MLWELLKLGLHHQLLLERQSTTGEEQSAKNSNGVVAPAVEAFCAEGVVLEDYKLDGRGELAPSELDKDDEGKERNRPWHGLRQRRACSVWNTAGSLVHNNATASQFMP